MSVAPHAGVVDFGTFTPPTASLNGIQGEVPQPLIGQENYVLTGNGWSSLGALGALTYQGTWDASTNTPTLVSSVGVQGYYYVVSVAGNTDLNGITTWDVGDWAIFNGSAWQKIEGGTVGTFTNVITPQVTARTDNLTLSAISTGTVTINTASANNTFLLVKDDTTAAASTTGLTVLGASSGLGRLALRSNKALYVASGSSNNISFLTNSGVVSEGSTQMLVGHTASAVNYVQVTGATTSNRPRISFEGSDGNIGGLYVAKGSGGHSFCSDSNASVVQFAISRIASAVNYLQAQGSSTGNQPFLTSQGTDTNVALGFASKGNGNLNFYTNSGSTLQFQVWDRPSADIYVAARGGVGAATRASIGAAGTGASGFNIYNSQGQAIRFQTNGEGNSEQFAITHTGTSVNYVQVTGAATGNRPAISAQGSDNPISLDINARGSAGTVRIGNALSTAFGIFQGVSGQTVVNYPTFIAGQTGFAIQTQATGTDTNISMAFQPKGTGAIDLAAGSSGVNISNGGTVTAITRTGNGTGYSSFPTVNITAPTTAGGVQAVATVANMQSIGASISAGGTGYTVGNVITITGGTPVTVAATFTVSAVSGGVVTAVTALNFAPYTVLPTAPVSTTGGSGTGLTLTALTWAIGSSFTISNAGSGYIEQPTITFSGGGGSGAAAYAVVGGVTTIRGLGSSSPGNIANSILFNTPSGTSFSIVDRAAVAVNYASAIGNVTTQPAIIRGLGSDTNVGLNLGTQGTGTITFSTSTTSSNVQFVVNHIASSVNYLQATGSATGNATGPILSAQGSDTNIPIQIQGKGTGSVAVLTPTTLGGTTGNTAELFAAKGSNSNSIWLRASQYRNATGTDWQTASLRLGQRIDTTDMSYIEFNPSGFPQGIAIQTANNQPINFNTSGAQFRVGVSASSVNYVQAAGGATTKLPIISAQGSDTNVSLGIQSKGTGAINLAGGSLGVNISNGNTVTAITRTNQGSGYTTITGFTWSASAPTTAGGVTATGTVTSLGGVSVTIAGGGTGYTAGNVLTVSGGTFSSASTIRVDTVSGGVITGATLTNGGTYTVIPSNPASVTGGSGTGATFNVSYGVVGLAIGTAGSGYIEEPTITFSGGGGSGAAAYPTIGSNTTITNLGNITTFATPNSNVLAIVDKNSGGGYPTNTTVAFSMVPNQNNFAANFFGSSAPFYFGTVSSSTTEAFNFATSVGSPVSNGSGGSSQFRIVHTASAVNYVQVTGSATTPSASTLPSISTQGSDTNTYLGIGVKGTGGYIAFYGAGGTNAQVLRISSANASSTNNLLQVSAAASGSAPTLSSIGTDTNISLNLVTKGTGTVQQNGNPLAQVNHKYHAFTVGAYYYDSYEQTNFFRLFSQNAAADTIRYGAVNTPEYYDYGTSTWTAWAAGLTGIQNLLDGNPNTGMDVAHANRTFRFVVTNSDGWPTNALVMLQSTWSAVTYTTATVTIASGTAVGGPFTTRQVMVFSPANTGNNWGLHAYYTGSIHTGEGFYQITIDLTDWVDVSTYTTYPLRNLNIFSNYSTVAGRILPFSNVYDKTSVFIGGIRTATDANGVLDIGRYSSVDPTSYIDSGSNATRIIFRTQYTAQLRIAHTASAVNYVQLTGGSTGNGVVFSAEGSDANINTFITSKGASSVVMQTNSRENFRVADGGTSVVNNLQAVGSNTGLAAILQARGSDTNIDISFVPKGTGRVKYGTHTATADAPITGYIEIVDSGGTIRKLAVIT